MLIFGAYAVSVLGGFISPLISPTAANQISTLTTQNYTLDSQFIIFVTAFILALNVFACYRSPSIAKGVVNIFIFVIIGFVWLVIKEGLFALSPLIPLGNNLALLSYDFFISSYFMALFGIMMTIAIIVCFRHTEQSEVEADNTINTYYGDIRSNDGIR